MRLVLFDIDGTLLLTHGAGMRALNRAFEVNHVLPDAVKAVHPDGKTDPQIVREIMTICGRDSECTDEMFAGFFTSYLVFLKEEMAVCTQLRIMPGVRELLARLAGEPDICVGVATGNIEEGAWIKLRHARLHSFFHFGGFGSDSEDRTELIRQAIAAAGGTNRPSRTPSGANGSTVATVDGSARDANARYFWYAWLSPANASLRLSMVFGIRMTPSLTVL